MPRSEPWRLGFVHVEANNISCILSAMPFSVSDQCAIIVVIIETASESQCSFHSGLFILASITIPLKPACCGGSSATLQGIAYTATHIRVTASTQALWGDLQSLGSALSTAG